MYFVCYILITVPGATKGKQKTNICSIKVLTNEQMYDILISHTERMFKEERL